MAKEGEPGSTRPIRPDKTAADIIREEAITNPDRIGFIDPQTVGRMMRKHFEGLTLEQFDANNRRANPHMYVDEIPETEREE